MYRKWLDTLLDLLFPEMQPCVFCWQEAEGHSSAGLCAKCAGQILAWSLELPSCPRCGRFTMSEKCPNCFDWTKELEGVTSVVPYFGMYKEKIFDLKFNNKTELAFPLGYLMAAKAERNLLGKLKKRQQLLVVPIPLHELRQEERGYNQSALLGRVIARQLGLGYNEQVLVRRHYELRQTLLGRRERRANTESVFAAQNIENLKGKDILLVDDVITTGATMRSAAQVLHAAGAGKINALTWATGFDKEFLFSK